MWQMFAFKPFIIIIRIIILKCQTIMNINIAHLKFTFLSFKFQFQYVCLYLKYQMMYLELMKYSLCLPNIVSYNNLKSIVSILCEIF